MSGIDKLALAFFAFAFVVATLYFAVGLGR